MVQHQEILEFHTRGQGLYEITSEVSGVVGQSGVGTGLCVVMVQHTSASLVIQENADPTAREDLQNTLARLFPEDDANHTHTTEGPDDMPSHLRSAVTRTAETIPVRWGRLTMGTWQGLFVWEHRRRPHTRKVVVHVMGE